MFVALRLVCADKVSNNALKQVRTTFKVLRQSPLKTGCLFKF